MSENRSTPSVALAVLHWKGRKHLECLLPTVKCATEAFGGRCEVLLVDNGATADPTTEAWMRGAFPWVEYIASAKNDYLYAYNLLASARDEDILIFLNDDLRIDRNFIGPLVRHFTKGDVFAVGATSRDWEDTYFSIGPARLKSHHGIYYSDFERFRQILSHTLFCSGACMAVDRRKFLELGGFNWFFYPAYGEDLDLGFRAWRRGWRCIFEPASVVYHRENASFDLSQDRRSKHLMRRAQFLFQWASLPPGANWFERTAMQLLLAWRHWRAGDKNWAVTWVKTWIEWRRLRKDFRWMKVSSQELQRICGEIDAPVVSR